MWCKGAMKSTDGALPPSHNFSIRRVTRRPNPLPTPCYRFTGSGDRPCDAPYTPITYALAPWTIPIRLDAALRYWSWSKIDTQNPYVYIDERSRPMAFPDNSWVEVTRYAERTSYVGSDGGGYGVWYWLVPGTGTSVNIGRSLRFDDKRAAISWANHHAPSNTTLACLDFENDSCDTHADALFCAAARHHGYASMVVRRDWIKMGHVSGSHSDVLELILCPAVEPPEQVVACPPAIEHRLAGGNASCSCNRSAELLACKELGDSGSYLMARDYGTRPVALVSVAATTFLGGPLILGIGMLAVWRRLSRGAPAVALGGRGGLDAVDDARPLLAMPHGAAAETAVCTPI